MALFSGALLIHGMRPGPLLLNNHPDLCWRLISSMYIGNVMLLVLNLPLIPLWVQVLKIPYRILFPLILLFCIVGYLLKKFDYEPAPLILAFVLGPMLEMNLRQALISSRGSFANFFTRPISTAILIIAVVLFFTPLISYILKKKKSE